MSDSDDLRDACLGRAGFDDGRFSELFKIPPTQWPTPVTGLVVADARAPFEAWAAKGDRVPY